MRKMRRARALPRPRRSQQLRASWLLVCMLPYLLLALISEGLHTDHLIVPSDAGVKTTVAALAGHGPHAQISAVAHSDHSDAECLACQWSASSTSVLPLLPLQLSPIVETPRIAEPVTALWTSRSTAAALGRGPPRA